MTFLLSLFLYSLLDWEGHGLAGDGHDEADHLEGRPGHRGVYSRFDELPHSEGVKALPFVFLEVDFLALFVELQGLIAIETQDHGTLQVLLQEIGEPIDIDRVDDGGVDRGLQILHAHLRKVFDLDTHVGWAVVDPGCASSLL